MITLITSGDEIEALPSLASLPCRVDVCFVENTEIYCFICNQGWIGGVRDDSYFV